MPFESKALARESPHFKRYALIANLLDQAFRVPGTRWRFGLDALIGLIPGAGDVVGACFGIYGVWVARRLGAPNSVQARMLANLGVDTLVGAVPLLGDLFDFAFKAQMRNRRLLEEWLELPRTTGRRSSWMLIALLVGVLAFTATAIALGYYALTWLNGALRAASF